MIQGHPPHVGTQTPGLGPYNTNREIPALGAGGETLAFGCNFTSLCGQTYLIQLDIVGISRPPRRRRAARAPCTSTVSSGESIHSTVICNEIGFIRLIKTKTRMHLTYAPLRIVPAHPRRNIPRNGRETAHLACRDPNPGLGPYNPSWHHANAPQQQPCCPLRISCPSLC